MTKKVLTANRLKDGDVVYLTADGGWSVWLDDAAIAETDEEAARFESLGQDAEQAREVVGAYTFGVTTENGTISPVGMRETIRAAGPSVRIDLGKQADERHK